MANAVITWNSDITVGKFFISYRKSNESQWSVPTKDNPTQNHFYTVEGLEDGQIYEFKITSECCNGSTDTIIEGKTLCKPTSNLIVLLQGQTSAVLSWDNVPWANSYRVRYRIEGNPSWTEIPGSPIIFNNTVITGLTQGKTYEFGVSVVCNSGESSMITNKLLIPCPQISAPVLIINNNVATFSWTGVSGGVYKVEYKKDTDITWTIAEASTTDTTININNLEFNQNYNFRVTILCGVDGVGNTLNINGSTNCPPISNLQGTSNVDVVTLTWTQGFLNQPVQVLYKRQDESTYTSYIDNYTNSSIQISGLTLGYIYNFRVIGKCGSFEINTLNTDVTLMCPSVTGLTAENIN